MPEEPKVKIRKNESPFRLGLTQLQEPLDYNLETQIAQSAADQADYPTHESNDRKDPVRGQSPAIRHNLTRETIKGR